MTNPYCSKEAWIGRIPAIIAALALACSVLANFWCETIVFRSDFVENEVSLGPWTRKATVLKEVEVVPSEGLDGIFGTGASDVREVEECVSHDESLGPKVVATRVFAVFASVLGGLLTATILLSPCMCHVVDKRWRGAGMLFGVVTIFQALTVGLFVTSNACQAEEVFRNNNTFRDCEWDWGTYVNIVSTVLWAATGALMLWVIKPFETPPRPPPQTQTITYTQTPQPDGGVVLSSEVVKGTYVPGNIHEANKTDP
mmetsp:Transcript_7702/g.17748  ORF Transcript_7702/g.17748 Transcript_7702/m.17748 type:complete len:256 (-) Transcript_7702:473-1240(-)